MSNRTERCSNSKKGKDLSFKSTIASVSKNGEDWRVLQSYKRGPVRAPLELQLKNNFEGAFQV